VSNFDTFIELVNIAWKFTKPYQLKPITQWVRKRLVPTAGTLGKNGIRSHSWSVSIAQVKYSRR